MRSSTILIYFLLCYVCSIVKTIKDEDFSEFDDFDQDEFVIETPSSTSAPPPSSSSKTQSNKLESTNDENIPQSKLTETQDDEVSIDDDDDAMFDEEEFETSDLFSSSTSSPDFKITEVPANLTGNRWEAYYCEAIMMIALLGYLIHFLIGRTKNSQLATIIYNSQRDLLERNFALVGDNGQTRNTQSSDEQINTMHKESENLYILWCSGRISMDSMLIELRFIKRQCLFNSLAALIKSINDTIVYTIDYGKDDMDTFVFCLARKRCAAKLHRDMNDLSQFCAERKNADKKGLSSNYQLLSELGEVSSAIIDTRVAEFMDKYEIENFSHNQINYNFTK
ncbi:unnamed protein product [Rotaria sordida]|uniref:PAT complex subunit CCDC47 n=1 Tax=Rotaria sordida TaxID=392033 RepID=A0A815CII9_9BILA|nr:unnamed protein product [Rotaria sordida]